MQLTAAALTAQVAVGLNDTIDNLMAAIKKNEKEISPSTLYAVACIEEGVPFINGSPQNTFVPGESPCPLRCRAWHVGAPSAAPDPVMHRASPQA